MPIEESNEELLVDGLIQFESDVHLFMNSICENRRRDIVIYSIIRNTFLNIVLRRGIRMQGVMFLNKNNHAQGVGLLETRYFRVDRKKIRFQSSRSGFVGFRSHFLE